MNMWGLVIPIKAQVWFWISVLVNSWTLRDGLR